MQAIFNIVAVPFGYVMRFIYDLVGNYGLSIIFFTLITKILLLPLSLKQKRSMARTMKLQPKIQALQKKYGNDQKRYNEELQNLYQDEGISPMAGCGSTLLTFPILIGLYYVIQNPLTYLMHLSANEISTVQTALGFGAAEKLSQISLANAITENFGSISGVCEKLIPMKFNFLGINLAATPSIKQFGLLWIVPLLAGVTALIMTLFMQKMQEKQTGQKPQQNMLMFLLSPAMSLYFAFILPAGLGLYWIINNILSIFQEWVLTEYIIKAERKQTGKADEE